MLVLKRNSEESIIAQTSDGDIEFKVLDFHLVNGSMSVKIGINAPREINVARKELLQRDENWGNR